MKKYILLAIASSLSISAYGQGACGAPTQQAFVSGATAVLESMATTPPTVLAVLQFHSDCSLSGVGNSNITGSWLFTQAANLQMTINTPTYNSGQLATLSSMTIGFYVVNGYVVGNFDFPPIVQSTLNVATGVFTQTDLNPYGPTNESAAYQLIAYPRGFVNLTAAVKPALPPNWKKSKKK